MNLLDHYLKPKKSNKLLIRAIIYSVIVIAIIIAWFLLASKVRSIYAYEAADLDKSLREVKDKYQERLTKSDKNVYELTLSAKELVEKGRSDLATIILSEALKRDEHYRDLYLYTAKVYFDLGDYRKALEILEKTQDIDPLYPQTQLLMAKTHEALGDVENAKLCYDKYEDFSK